MLTTRAFEGIRTLGGRHPRRGRGRRAVVGPAPRAGPGERPRQVPVPRADPSPVLGGAGARPRRGSRAGAPRGRWAADAHGGSSEPRPVALVCGSRRGVVLRRAAGARGGPCSMGGGRDRRRRGDGQGGRPRRPFNPWEGRMKAGGEVGTGCLAFGEAVQILKSTSARARAGERGRAGRGSTAAAAPERYKIQSSNYYKLHR
mmetsp:Transcript_44395/g.141323  ORF Transcript_44395/g.141323 Transcript_44395/m.141323 type:complete len:202 (+) Transcript_44395:947-1552(+)